MALGPLVEERGSGTELDLERGGGNLMKRGKEKKVNGIGPNPREKKQP